MHVMHAHAQSESKGEGSGCLSFFSLRHSRRLIDRTLTFSRTSSLLQITDLLSCSFKITAFTTTTSQKSENWEVRGVWVEWFDPTQERCLPDKHDLTFFAPFQTFPAASRVIQSHYYLSDTLKGAEFTNSLSRHTQCQNLRIFDAVSYLSEPKTATRI